MSGALMAAGLLCPRGLARDGSGAQGSLGCGAVSGCGRRAWAWGSAQNPGRGGWPAIGCGPEALGVPCLPLGSFKLYIKTQR